MSVTQTCMQAFVDLILRDFPDFYPLVSGEGNGNLQLHRRNPWWSRLWRGPCGTEVLVEISARDDSPFPWSGPLQAILVIAKGERFYWQAKQIAKQYPGDAEVTIRD